MANDCGIDPQRLSLGEQALVRDVEAELANALDVLRDLPPCVAFFGSSRVQPSAPVYTQTRYLARLVAEQGFGVVTGGGPGLMAAANHGARDAGGASIGLHIDLPNEQYANAYLATRCDFSHFFLRKLMFAKLAVAYVVMPGGMGTLNELTDSLVLLLTGKIEPMPMILYDASFWRGWLDWLRKALEGRGYLSHEELDMLTICDTPEQVMKVLSFIQQ